MQDLLRYMVGVPGAKALENLCKQADINTLLLNRVVLGWLQTQSGPTIEIQGLATPTTLIKSDRGISGLIQFPDFGFNFTDESPERVTALITLSLGHPPDLAQMPNVNLPKLGKTIDVLIKAQTATREMGARDAQDTHLAPVGPTAPTRNVGTVKPKLPKLPRGSRLPKPILPTTVAMTKAEGFAKCPVCRSAQIVGQVFRGCYCLTSLRKSTECAVTPTGYILKLGPAWDQDAIRVLLESVGRHV